MSLSGRKSEIFVVFLILLDIGLILLIILSFSGIIEILSWEETFALFAPLFFSLFGTVVLIIRISQNRRSKAEKREID